MALVKCLPRNDLQPLPLGDTLGSAFGSVWAVGRDTRHLVYVMTSECPRMICVHVARPSSAIHTLTTYTCMFPSGRFCSWLPWPLTPELLVWGSRFLDSHCFSLNPSQTSATLGRVFLLRWPLLPPGPRKVMPRIQRKKSQVSRTKSILSEISCFCAHQAENK